MTPPSEDKPSSLIPWHHQELLALRSELSQVKDVVKNLRVELKDYREALEKIEKYAFKASGDEILMWAQAPLYRHENNQATNDKGKDTNCFHCGEDPCKGAI